MDGGLSRAQIAVYAALGVVLLLLGVKAMRGSDAEGSSAPGGITLAREPVGGRAAEGGDLVVHVAGAVAKPGVYRMPAGSRVADAVERAGGPEGGSTDSINLAARLGDGQQVVVPARETGPGGGGSSAAAAAASGEEGPISLGSASAAELESIDGIGPVTAAKILEFRDQNGGVGSIEELDQVPGIGPATIESLSARLQP